MWLTLGAAYLQHAHFSLPEVPLQWPERQLAELRPEWRRMPWSIWQAEPNLSPFRRAASSLASRFGPKGGSCCVAPALFVFTHCFSGWSKSQKITPSFLGWFHDFVIFFRVETPGVENLSCFSRWIWRRGRKTMVLRTNFVCELKIRVEKKMNLLV